MDSDPDAPPPSAAPDQNVREQWQVGANTYDELDAGESSRPTLTQMRAAIKHVSDADYVCIVCHAATSKYDYALAWQSVVADTGMLLQDLEQAQQMVDDEEIDEESMIQELVAGWTGADVTDVIGFSFSVGHEGVSKPKEVR